MKKLSIMAAMSLSCLYGQAQQMKTSDVNYNNRIMFFEGYERTEDNSVYFGLVAWISPNYLSHSDAWIFEGEARLGYNHAFNKKTKLTAYAGGGYLDDIKRSHQHHRSYLRHLKEHSLEFGYGAIGVNISHMFDHLFGVGLNVKGMYGKGTIGSVYHDNEWAGGMDIGVPLIFKFGGHRRFDIRFEPFYMFLKSSQDETNYLGNRLFVGVGF